MADQLAGCLIGLCLGDALGAVVEAAPPADARRYVDEYLRAGRAGERGRGSLPFGQYTDDGQLARELLVSYVEARGFSPRAYADRIAALVAENRLMGGGPGTTGAARQLLQGVAWRDAGAPAPYAGNGSAMRAAPLGVLFSQNPDALTRAAIDQSRITHQDARCAAGALAIAGAASLAGCGTTIDRVAFLERLRQWTEPIATSVSSAIHALAEWGDLEPEEASRRIAGLGLQSGGADGQGIDSFVTTSVCWSLYAFLRTPDDYWETVCTAIAVGGDTDTMAAMAGGISGARLGLAALPGSLARRLNDSGDWGYESLVGLAEECARASTE
jgi:ADP-ribosylglycohydrolase